MQIGMIGLGKMGGNMSRRLMKAGHQPFAAGACYDDESVFELNLKKHIVVFDRRRAPRWALDNNNGFQTCGSVTTRHSHREDWSKLPVLTDHAK
jgi:pyrroline-5-carboxylate reductase